jgi:hypothetical protein
MRRLNPGSVRRAVRTSQRADRCGPEVGSFFPRERASHQGISNGSGDCHRQCLICSPAGGGPFDLSISGRQRDVPAGDTTVARPACLALGGCPCLCKARRAPA